MKEMYWIGYKGGAPYPSRKNRTKTTDLSKAWKQFLWWVNMGLGQPNVTLNSRNKGVLAYSDEREDYPKGDIFDRMRVRVTGAMPQEFRNKIMEDIKAGKRLMRIY